MPAFEAFSGNGATETANFSWSHAGVAPDGVTVGVIQAGNVAETIGATYGGVAMAHVASSPFQSVNFAEIGGLTIHVLRLNAGIPAGTQTIAVTKSGAAGCMGFAWTDTGTGATEVQAVNTAIDSASQANPSSSIALGGVNCLVLQVLGSGQGAVTAITPLTDWTADQELDLGSLTTAAYRYTVIGSTDVTVGWTQTADDAAAFAIAIRDPAAAGGDIAATGTLAFGSSAALTATGALGATGTMAFAGSADLNATGTLAATGAMAFAGAAALDAIGQLSASGAMAFAAAAALDATGTLAATGAMAFSGAAALGSGSVNDLAAVGAMAFAGVADLDATGTLAAVGALAITGAADLDATGALAAAGALAFAGTADLDATGSLNATGALAFAGTASLDAIGQMAGVGALTWGSAAALTDANAAVQPEVIAITAHGGRAILTGLVRHTMTGQNSLLIEI